MISSNIYKGKEIEIKYIVQLLLPFIGEMKTVISLIYIV